MAEKRRYTDPRERWFWFILKVVVLPFCAVAAAAAYAFHRLAAEF